MNFKLSVINTFYVFLLFSFSKNELVKNNKTEIDYQVFDDSDKLFECGDNKTCAIVCSDENKNCKIKTEQKIQLKNQTITFCHDDEFLCKNGECINAKFKCDGKQDCVDSSDELNCTKINEDLNIELDCIFPSKPCFGIKQNKTICLPIENFCDNRKHCINGTDEGGFCDKDPCFNSNCTGTCHNTPQGALCYCPEGSTLAADGHSCLKRGSFCEFGVCSQICVPLKNRHKCQCNLNYTLESDGFSCKSDDDRPAYIIFSNRHEIRSVDINSMTMSRPLVSGLKNTIALDFFYSSKGDLIFWTDVIDDKIYKGSIIHGSLINIQVIVETGLSTAEGLAVDWIGENIYWVESNLDQIEVTKFDGSSRKTLIAGNMESPRSVALDSRYRVMFWSDWDTQQPRIESASMSGEDRIVIYNMTNKDGAWPNGLTLDYQNLRIYWVDARTDSIQTITYEGKDHHEILRNHDLSTHPFAITLFGNYIYWTDWKTNSVIKCNKFNGSEVSVVQKVMTQPFDIKIYHPSRQPVLNSTHPCSFNNGGCSHLCLLSKKHMFKCECPHIMKLDKNNKTCIPNEKILLFARPNEIRGLDLENIHYHIIPPISLPKIIHTEQIDFNAKEKRIYWADTESNELKRSSLNSSVVEVIMDSVIETPFGFTLDWISNNLFVTSQETSAKIYVSKLNGEYIHSLNIKNLSKPFSLAIDPFNGLLFWADHGSENLEPIIHPYIGMSKMDGSNSQKLVSSETEQLLSKPTSLTVKFEGFTVVKLYWSNIGSGSIQYYNFKDKKVYTIWNDNANPQKLILGPYALCLKGDNLMFSSQKHSFLYEISKNGNITEIPLLKNQSEVITALKIYDKNLQYGQNLCSVNNGNCSQLCLPVSSTKRKCKCAIGFEVDSKNETKCKGSNEFLICSSNLSLKGISLDQNFVNGTLINSKQLLPPISKVLMAVNIDFVYKDSFIYWVDNDEGSITRIKQDSTNHQTVIKNLEAVEGMAIDWIAENIYWIESTYQVIEVSRLNGSSRYVIISGNMTKPTSLAIDPIEGYLFWSDIGDSVQILRSRLDGSERVTIFNESNKSYINKIALDIQEKKIYWSDSKKLIIERSNYDGKNKALVYRNNYYLKNLVSFSIHKQFIYWADTLFEGGSILKIEKNSFNNTMGNATLIAVKLGDHIKDIKVYREQPSNKQNPCAINNGGCSELCIFIKNNKHRCICSHGKLSKNGKSCEPYETFIMFSRIVDIDSIQISDDNIHNSPYPIISNKTYMQNVIGLTFDYNSKKIIYSDIQKGSINSMNFNGTDHKVLIDKQGAVEGVAFDSLTNQLYWTSNSDASINRLIISFLSLNNTAEKIIKLSNNDKPRGIAIDSCKSMIYWTNWNVAKPSIQRSFLNGQVMESIITTKIRMPNAITLDHKLQKLYWSDARLDKIERCNYDGSDRIVIITESPQHPFDLAIYGEYLFWTDWVAHGVYRANKFTGSNLKMLKKKVPRPMGIIAVANDTEDCTLNQCIKNSSLCVEKPIYGCTDKEFSCDNGLCIPLTFKCDGELDCSDHSDEYPKQNCSKIQCKPDVEFQCKNGQCISKAYICDNENDCKDGSDEHEDTCVDFKCNTTIEFQCSNHKCISLWQVCDDKDDCGDGSDEKNCVKNKCKANEFKCHKKCIPENLLCNGFNDCADFSDESPENCLIQKDLICNLKDKKSCKSFNICDKRVCSQFCNSTSESYSCSCANGFKSLKNATSCLVDSSLSPVLLFSNRFVIRQTDLNGYESNQKVSYLRNAVALDFDYLERCIYWSNIMPLGSLIERSCDGKKDLYGHPLKETIQSKNILSPDGLAVDWIGKNLYWCDKVKDTIEVSKLDGKYRKTIVNKNLQEPRAIVLDPYSGYMYWTDWGIKPYIGKAGMDGSNFKIIISENLGWPNALAIDYITKEIFWADAKEDYIAVADYEGNRKSIIISELNSNAVNHIFALSVFEDYIYWTDWDSKSVQKCNKYNCKNSTKLADVLHRPMDIQVYHPFKQEPLNHSNPCDKLNCQTICLLKPGLKPNELSATCACPENFILNSDKRTCSSNCTSSQFVCLNSFKCVNYWSKFEQETCNNQTCVPDYTYCKQGHCLENKWVCEKPYSCLDKDFCYNNGRCYMDKVIIANETTFLPKCKCKNYNFKGDRCEHCENLNCKNGGFCVLPNNSTNSECRCLEGFYGNDCSKQLIDHCGCKNEGFCEINKNLKTYACICPSNYMGKHCEIYIASSCLKTKCKNNGICKMNQDDQQTYCQCPKEFKGVFCEIPVEETKCEKNCLNGGKCIIINKISTCKCKNDNYKGDRCESFIESKIDTPKEQKSSKKLIYAYIGFGFVTFLVIFLIIGFTFNFYKRNILFMHQRMNETHENLEIRNPIFDEDLNDENITESSNYDYSYNNDERKGITNISYSYDSPKLDESRNLLLDNEKDQLSSSQNPENEKLHPLA